MRDFAYDLDAMNDPAIFLKSNFDEPCVYVPMSADIIHPGHINLLNVASAYGSVVVGLFSDEAISSYKHEPAMKYDERKKVIRALRAVDAVLCQETRDYSTNLVLLKPKYMVHGTDWREGPLADVRQKAIELISEWDGSVIEPEYTKGISSSKLKERMRSQRDS